MGGGGEGDIIMYEIVMMDKAVKALRSLMLRIGKKYIRR
jgi:hypothetical protein